MSRDEQVAVSTDTTISRQQRRYLERQRAKAERHKLTKMQRVRRQFDPLAIHYPTAMLCLMTGPEAKRPSFRAIRKTARFLLAFPKQRIVSRHLWGSWRSWPRSFKGESNEAVRDHAE